jgi:uncharacterized UPF0160 family protein
METEKHQVIIGTHSGVFHADDAMGCMLLRHFTLKFKNAPVVRSRDPKVWETVDILLDVGGVYDAALHRYDHHQKGFNETFSKSSDIKLSASGLIYKHFGKEIIAAAFETLLGEGTIPENLRGRLTPEALDSMYHECYRGLMVTLDAIDNGIDRYPKDVKPKYEFYRTDLASRVGRLNPAWWDDPTPEAFDKNFEKAMALCREEFLEKIKVEIMGGIASHSIVEEAFKTGSQLDNRVVVLAKPCFWKESLFKVEEALGRVGKTRFILYPDSNGEGFRAQAVPVNLSTFENRGGLKEEWRGLDAKALVEKSGIEDAVFCHHSGFIGGAKSLQSTLKMAELSLE